MSPSRPVSSDSPTRLDQLDGLRAIAVAGVVVQHALGFLPVWPLNVWFESGTAGVRLFFVLSGFLITGILLRARQSAAVCHVSRWVVWRAFYIRRALRILPLAYLVLAVAWLAGFPSIREHPWMYALYVSNVQVARHGFTDPGLDHFWSLAIEEQFYLFWPVVLLATPRKWIAPAMGTIAAASVVARAAILSTPGGVPPFVRAMVMTPSRLDALAIGGLLAWQQMAYPRATRLTVAALLIGGIAARFGANLLSESVLVMPLPETGDVLLCAALVLSVSQGIGGILGRALAMRPVVAIGTISYGIYVYHMVLAALIPAFPLPYGYTRLVWMVGATVPVAALSWRWFERPLNDLKERFPYVPAPARGPASSSLEHREGPEASALASRAAAG